MSENEQQLEKQQPEKVLKAIYGTPDSPLHIEGIDIPCYVLENEERVIVQRGLLRAIGIQRGGSHTEKFREYGGSARLAYFLETYGVMSLASNEIGVLLKNPIKFTYKGTTYFGYKATVLQQIIRVIAKAYLRGRLPERFQELGANAEKLDDAFGKIGITALVDEATGYQDVRHRQALQRLLDKYLLTDYAKWAKRFPDTFYAEMFRLKNWPLDLKTMKKPGIVGTYTNNIVYQRLAPGVFAELQKRNPKVNGRRKAKNFQYLTEEIGIPALDRHLDIVEAFMRAAPNWNYFLRMLDRAIPKQNDQLVLNLAHYDKSELEEATDEEVPESDE